MLGNKLIRLPEVEQVTGLKKSYIYQLIKEGSFPAPVRLGSRAVRWHLKEVQSWIEGLPRTSSC